MKKNSFLTGLFVACVLLLTSCDSIINTVYVPYKSSEDSKWGMISMDGSVLFENEFKHCPTCVSNGIFYVKNGNDMWEMYEASENPEKVGEEYIGICPFTAEVTPAVKKNERITLINKSGKVTATLDKAKGKSIKACFAFTFGYAIIRTEDDKFGAIDTRGNVIIDPKYDQLFPIDQDMLAGYNTEPEKDYDNFSFITPKGSVKMTLNVGRGQKYSSIDIMNSVNSSKYLAVCTKTDGEDYWGYINYNKEVILKPSKKVRGIGSLLDDKFIYQNDEGKVGLMSIDGEVIIRAKYDNLRFASKDLLICCNDDKYEVINLNGDKVTKDEYEYITEFMDNNHAAVKIDDNSWGFIGKNGEELKDVKVDIYDISLYTAASYVESDFVDYDAIIADLMLTKYGMMGFSIKMSSLQVIQNFNEKKNDNQEKIEEDAGSNTYRSSVEITKNYKGIEVTTGVYYEDYMASQVARHPFTGEILYDWNEIFGENKHSIIGIITGGNMKAKTIFSKIVSKVKSFGTVYRENGGAIVVKIDDKIGWMVYYEGDEVHMVVAGDSSYKEFDIDKYAINGEETRGNSDYGTVAYDTSELENDTYDSSNSSNHIVHYHLEGLINDKYGVVVNLKKSGYTLTGRYYYTSTMRKLGDIEATYIELSGSINEEGDVELVATYHDSNMVEIWEGKLSNNELYAVCRNTGKILEMKVH